MTNNLWPWLITLILLAMLFVVLPVWRYRGAAAESVMARRKAKNREVFLQRQQELANDREQGIVNAEEHDMLLAELQRAFLADMEALDVQGSRMAWAGGKALLLGLALLVPVASLLIYRSWGAGPDLALPGLLERMQVAESEEAQSAVLDELAAFLEARFERRPDDIQNGYMLGTLYLGLERHGEAIATFETLLARMEDGPDRATVLGELAQAQYLQAGSQLTPVVQGTIDEALRLNPNEYAVMSILGIDAFLKEDFTGALAYWRRQLSSATPGSQQAQTLRQRIAMVEAYLPAEQRETPAPVSGPSITLVVDIAPELAAQVPDTVSLFVYARRPDLPMPILAQNIPVPEFPFTITLDNSMSMTGMTLESAPQLVVGARLSRSGVANAQSGDLQTLSAPFALAELGGPVELVIDEIVR